MRAHHIHSPRWSDAPCNTISAFQPIRNCVKTQSQVLRAFHSWVRTPPRELCCTHTVVFGSCNGCSDLTTIGRGWGSVSDGLGLQLLLWLLQPRCERKAPRSEGAVCLFNVLMTCCYQRCIHNLCCCCVLLVITTSSNKSPLLCCRYRCLVRKYQVCWCWT